MANPSSLLNEGLALLEQELKSDVIAAKRVRILVIQYGAHDEAVVASNWCDAMDFTAPRLEANGTTPTGAAVELALAEIEQEKQRFRQAGVAYTRPWLFLMSDGEPTDRWQHGAEQARAAEQANKVAIFPIAVGDNANIDMPGAVFQPWRAGRQAAERLAVPRTVPVAERQHAGGVAIASGRAGAAGLDGRLVCREYVKAR